ncbi:hypothetical protein [Novosphingobium sp. AP12]|uniref:hypothetical protein n=1 Tax=Novosphingobium sp. AP12 TaxID=1144305 RepID=UPI0012FA133E|nr:hypothetical protein [Novosphingobium sp. AP12]
MKQDFTNLCIKVEGGKYRVRHEVGFEMRLEVWQTAGGPLIAVLATDVETREALWNLVTRWICAAPRWTPLTVPNERGRC